MWMCHYKEVIAALRDVLQWNNDIESGGANYSSLGRKPIGALMRPMGHSRHDETRSYRVPDYSSALQHTSRYCTAQWILSKLHDEYHFKGQHYGERGSATYPCRHHILSFRSSPRVR